MHNFLSTKLVCSNLSIIFKLQKQGKGDSGLFAEIVRNFCGPIETEDVADCLPNIL